MERANPFIAGPPIEDEKRFFGRDALIQQLLQHLSEPEKSSFLLYGPRRIGKTTVLKQLEYYLSDEGFTQIYFDLAGKTHLKLNELLFEISQAIANACAFEPPRFESFDHEGRFFLEAFLPVVEKSDEVGDLALLFDDLDAIDQNKDAAQTGFLPFLSQTLKVLRSTKIICSLDSGSPHFELSARFDVAMPVTRFTRRNFEKLLQETGTFALQWHPAAFDRLWDLTKGHPYVAQAFGAVLWDTLQPVGKTVAVDPHIIDDVSGASFLRLQPFFDSTWRNLNGDEQAFFQLLLNHGDGPIPLDQIYAQLGRNGRVNQINSILGRFQTLDIIEHVDREKQSIAFSVPLFKNWVTEQIRQDIERVEAEKTKVKKVSEVPLEAPKPDSDTVEQQDWEAIVDECELELIRNPENSDMRAKLRHARNQLHLAIRYEKALDAISNQNYESAQKLLAEVILRDPAYREAPRFLLLATTGIDAKELKQRMEREQSELEQAKSQIKSLQQEIAKSQFSDHEAKTAQKEIELLKAQVASAESREHEYKENLSSANQAINNLRAAQAKQTAPVVPVSVPPGPPAQSPVTPKAAAPPAAKSMAQSGPGMQPSAIPNVQANTKEAEAKLQDSLKMLDSILEGTDQIVSRPGPARPVQRPAPKAPPLPKNPPAPMSPAPQQPVQKTAPNERVPQPPPQQIASSTTIPKGPAGVAPHQPVGQATHPMAQKPAAQHRPPQPVPQQSAPSTTMPKGSAGAVPQQPVGQATHPMAQKPAAQHSPPQPSVQPAPQRPVPQPRRDENAFRQQNEQRPAPQRKPSKSTLQKKLEKAMQESTFKAPEKVREVPRQSAPPRPKTAVEAKTELAKTKSASPAKPKPQPTRSATAASKPVPERRKTVADKQAASSFTDTSTIEAGTVKRVPDEKSWMSAKAEEPKRTPSGRQSQPSPTPASRPEPRPRPVAPPRPRPAQQPEKPVLRPYSKPQEKRTSGQPESLLFQRQVAMENRRKRTQASWIAGTMNFLPVFLWSLWLWYVQPLEWGNGGKFFVLLASIPAWLAVARFGLSDKDKHIRGFLGVAPVVALTFFGVLISETLQPGIPPIVQGNDVLIFIGIIVYSIIMILFSVQSGKVASIATMCSLASGAAAAALFLMGGGSIEATIVLAIIGAIMLIIHKVNVGEAIGAGVGASIPAGFLLFALTHRTIADSGGTIFRASILSLLSFFVVAGIIYLLVALFSKQFKKTIL